MGSKPFSCANLVLFAPMSETRPNFFSAPTLINKSSNDPISCVYASISSFRGSNHYQAICSNTDQTFYLIKEARNRVCATIVSGTLIVSSLQDCLIANIFFGMVKRAMELSAQYIIDAAVSPQWSEFTQSFAKKHQELDVLIKRIGAIGLRKDSGITG